MTEKTWKLTPEVASRTDVARLQRELEAIDSFLVQSKVRSPNVAPKLPQLSLVLEELTKANNLDLLTGDDRKQMVAFLSELRGSAPIVHISFASNPSAAFRQKITLWFREHIHPFIFLQIGLQPDIAAGCVVRTTNHSFDLSLRQHFKANQQLLIEKINGEAKKA